jgi:large subunit ribosomal protein L15
MLVEKTQSSEITLETLRANGLLAKNDLVKILGQGKLTSKINVTAHAISQSAKAAIEELGGTVTLVGAPSAE